jgi:hypothetical protein
MTNLADNSIYKLTLPPKHKVPMEPEVSICSSFSYSIFSMVRIVLVSAAASYDALLPVVHSLIAGRSVTIEYCMLAF